MLKKAVIEMVINIVSTMDADGYEEYQPISDGNDNYLYAETLDSLEPLSFFWVNQDTGEAFPVDVIALPINRCFLWSGIFPPLEKESEGLSDDGRDGIISNFEYITPIMEVYIKV